MFQRKVGLEARLDLLRQDEWWVTATGWEAFLATYTARNEVVCTTDDHGCPLSTPRTVSVPAYYNLADRLAVVGVDNRATVKVADMSVGHRQNVIMMLNKLRNSLFMYHFARVDQLLPFDDERWWEDEWGTLGRCLTSAEKLHAWFEEFALIRALRAATIADKEARLGGPVLLGH